MDLKAKTILITGGARVGQYVARELAAAGANLAMTYLKSEEEVTATIKEAEGSGVKARAYQADISKEMDVVNLLQQVAADFGGIDGLVSMASIFKPDPAAVDTAFLQKLFGINTFGNILVARGFAEQAKQRGLHNAPIVSFIDWAIDHPYGQYDVYLATKAALRHYLMALQTSYAGIVRVVNIHPGMILEPTNFSAEEKADIIRNTPVGEIGTPEQAAKLVRLGLELDYLADNIYLDGGQHWRHRLA